MGDLIWVGNTLYPRSVAIAAAIVIVLALAAAVVVIRSVRTTAPVTK